MKIPFEKISVINLESTNYCNLRCAQCGDDRTRQVGYMSLQLAESLARQCQRHQEIRLFMSGEPLFHPKIAQIIQIARRYVDTVVIHTNATRLDKRMANALVDAGLTHLSISFDGLNKEEYEENRKGADFEIVRNNILSWLQTNQGRVHTTIRRIVGKDQKREDVNQLLPGADLYRVIERHSWDILGKIDGAYNVQHEVPCYFIHNYLSILWDGRVVLCCADLNGRFIIGDSRTESLSQIWNGERMRDIRSRQMKRIPIPEICSSCERYQF